MQFPKKILTFACCLYLVLKLALAFCTEVHLKQERENAVCYGWHPSHEVREHCVEGAGWKRKCFTKRDLIYTCTENGNRRWKDKIKLRAFFFLLKCSGDINKDFNCVCILIELEVCRQTSHQKDDTGFSFIPLKKFSLGSGEGYSCTANLIKELFSF